MTPSDLVYCGVRNWPVFPSLPVPLGLCEWECGVVGVLSIELHCAQLCFCEVVDGLEALWSELVREAVLALDCSEAEAQGEVLRLECSRVDAASSSVELLNGRQAHAQVDSTIHGCIPAPELLESGCWVLAGVGTHELLDHVILIL